MNEVEKLDQRRRLFYALLVFLVVLALAAAFQDILREIVLIPVLYVIWVGKLAFRGLDQRCIWSVLLFLAILFSQVLLRPSRRPPPLVRPASRREAPAGRIHFWREQVRAASGKLFARRYRSSDLRQLVTHVLAYRQHTTADKVMKEIRTGQLDIPSQVCYALCLDDREDDASKSIRLPGRIQRWLDWVLGRTENSLLRPNPNLEQTADYLESLMEVDDDIGNR